uniref:GrBNV_gp67-like protein n=1 Tax=Nilaparvata lugens endogenous nudivirus TaxID=1487700 RepID=X5GWC0_9VIRU|nr:GrBNV_gp67-like protein [Nilaparvata lugens endogenous nudivirus]
MGVADDEFVRAALYATCKKSKILSLLKLEAMDVQTLKYHVNKMHAMSFQEMPILLTKMAVKFGVGFVRDKIPIIKDYVNPDNLQVKIEDDELAYLLNVDESKLNSKMKTNIYMIVLRNIAFSILGVSIENLKNTIIEAAHSASNQQQQQQQTEQPLITVTSVEQPIVSPNPPKTYTNTFITTTPPPPPNTDRGGVDDDDDDEVMEIGSTHHHNKEDNDDDGMQGGVESDYEILQQSLNDDVDTQPNSDVDENNVDDDDDDDLLHDKVVDVEIHHKSSSPPPPPNKTQRTETLGETALNDFINSRKLIDEPNKFANIDPDVFLSLIRPKHQPTLSSVNSEEATVVDILTPRPPSTTPPKRKISTDKDVDNNKRRRRQFNEDESDNSSSSSSINEFRQVNNKHDDDDNDEYDEEVEMINYPSIHKKSLLQPTNASISFMDNNDDDDDEEDENAIIFDNEND